MSLTEKDYLKKLDIKILILSRGRYNTITTHKIMPDYIEILVPESEKQLYEENLNNPILTIPDEVKGLGKVRNWVLNNFKEETIIMIDDDIKNFCCLTNYRTYRIEKEEMIQVLINTAVMAKDAGVHCFGFNQTDIRKYNGCDPFNLCTWVGCIIGVIGRGHFFRDDKYKVDIDFCLKNIMTDRIVFVNNMYHAFQNRDNNAGGNSIFRTQDDYEKSLETLKDKWGKYLKVRNNHKSQVKITLNVERKQKIEYEK